MLLDDSKNLIENINMLMSVFSYKRSKLVVKLMTLLALENTTLFPEVDFIFLESCTFERMLSFFIPMAVIDDAAKFHI